MVPHPCHPHGTPIPRAHSLQGLAQCLACNTTCSKPPHPPSPSPAFFHPSTLIAAASYSARCDPREAARFSLFSAALERRQWPLQSAILAPQAMPSCGAARTLAYVFSTSPHHLYPPAYGDGCVFGLKKCPVKIKGPGMPLEEPSWSLTRGLTANFLYHCTGFAPAFVASWPEFDDVH